MIYEIVVQTVDPARRDEYVDAYRKAFREANMAGNHGGKICTSVEDPARVVVMIEWDSVEAHKQHPGTAPHNAFREKIYAFQTQPSDLQHYVVEDL
jgi:heme-degrading monooxygenase HmoA